jgi:hypothetical protein
MIPRYILLWLTCRDASRPSLWGHCLRSPVPTDLATPVGYTTPKHTHAASQQKSLFPLLGIEPSGDACSVS